MLKKKSPDPLPSVTKDSYRVVYFEDVKGNPSVPMGPGFVIQNLHKRIKGRLFESGRIVLKYPHNEIFRGSQECVDILFMRTIHYKSIVCASVVDIGHKVIPLAFIQKDLPEVNYSHELIPPEWKHYIEPILKHLVKQPIAGKYEYTIENDPRLPKSETVVKSGTGHKGK